MTLVFWLALLIPIIFSIIGRIFYHEKVIWLEVIIPTIFIGIVIFAMQAYMLNSQTEDTEYLTEYIVKAEYYEEWDEWIEDTCSQTCCCDSEGSNCSTTYYDCSYNDYNPAEWYIIMNTGNKYSVSKDYYLYLVKRFNNQSFKDLHRDYDKIDGDKYYTLIDDKFENIIPYSYEYTYKNKTQYNTVFKFKELDSIESKDLYEYPKVVKSHQEVCLGCNYESNLKLKRYNALIGKNKQVKIFILVFNNKNISIAEKQKQYWKGGNKNELVICIDKDKKWSKTFSWCDDKVIEVESSSLFLSNKSISNNIDDLIPLVKTKYKRKSFSDFDYIKVHLSLKQTIIIFIVSIVLSIGKLIFAVKNNIY